MRGWSIFLCLGLCLLSALPSSAVAQAQKRFALLIGNQSYDRSVGVLRNPHNDIALVAGALSKQQFDILPLVKDAKRSEILGAVRQLAGKLKVAGAGAVGMLYYSGHGAAEKDTNINYLIPIDAKDPGTVTFWDESLKLDDIMRLLDQAPAAVKFVIFDACRNELQLPTRDTSKGLVPVAEQLGYFVAYASAPGRAATDRGERSGPYAGALSEELGRQGLDHLNLFQNVKERVIASTQGAQHPWESNGLSRRVYLTGEPTMAADVALWESVRTTNNVPTLQRYIEQFPKGLFAATAEQMIARLNAEAAREEAAKKGEIARKEAETRQADELRKALEEARRARAAEIEARRIAAERVNQATAVREAAEKEVQKGVASSRDTAVAVDKKLQSAAEEARSTHDALAMAESRLKASEQRLAELEKAYNEAQRTTTEPKVAALTPPVDPAAHAFDGLWIFKRSSTAVCGPNHAEFPVRINRGVVTGPGGKGTISPSGKIWVPGKGNNFSGMLKGNSGSGTYEGLCQGTFVAERRAK